MNKEFYESVETEIIYFESDDIIATSNNETPGLEEENNFFK